LSTLKFGHEPAGNESVGVVTISGVRDAAYYEDYASLTDTPPRWLGSAAALELGLTRAPVVSELGPDGRRVREGDVVRLLDARHPVTGASLLDPQHRRSDRRAGFDICFSAPKSVSVLAMAAQLAGDGDTANAVWEAHRQAVAETFEWMERELFVGRRGHDGRDGTVRARVCAVAFDHLTSREDDPQLHTHVVLANLGRGEDGAWGALWTDTFWRGRHSREHVVRATSAIYGAALRAELTRRLGVAWTEPKGRDRHREVEGIPRRVRDEFSRRRRQVTEHLAAAGVGDGGKARQAAQMRTRSEKSERPASELAAEWLARLERLRVQPHRLLRQVQRHARARRAKEAAEPAMPDMSEVLAGLHGPGGRPTWTRHDLLGALAAAAPNGARPDLLEQWADAILGSGAVVEVSAPLTAEAEGMAAHGPGGAVRYASRAMWQAEEAVVQIVSSTKRNGVNPEIVERIVARSTLDPEQAAMVRAITGDGFVHVVAASAGSGKTFALGQALKVWQRAGKDVLGIGPSWRAANELSDVGFRSSWAYDALVGPAGPGLNAIPRGGVLVVDESSMLPTRALVALLQTAHKRGAQVVLVGDPRQLSSVEAGGLYAMIGLHLGAVHLTQNRRQAADWQVEALRDIREGRSDRAVEALAQHGDVVLAADEASAVGRLLADWWEARRAGTEVAILASTRAGADSLNALVHARLAAAGVLGRKSVTLKESPKHDGMPVRELRPDDEIRFRKRQYFPGRLSVANGDTATVESVSPTHIELRLRDGHVVRSTVSWATDHVDYGYASTIHASQGRTVGTARAKRERGGQGKRGECFVLAADSLALEGAYVAASRAVDRTRLYLSPTADPEHDTHLYDREGRPLNTPPADPLSRAAASWARPDSDESAVAEATRAAEIAGLAGRDRGELEAEREAVAGIIAATVAGKADADLVSARARLEVLDAALEARRRAEVADLALAATAGEGAGWVTSVLGPVPEDRPGQLRWREGAGALVDAKHWVVQARSSSRSDYVQAQAAPEKVASDLAALAKHDDRRRLEALADAQAVATLRQALVERFDGNDRWAAAASTPASDRLLMAAAWLGDLSLDGVSEEAERLAGVGASPEAAIATALQRATSASVARRAERGEPVPLAVAAAAEPGVPLPAVRALTEAAEIGAELRAREPEPEVPAPTSQGAPAGASSVSRAPAGAPEETDDPSIPVMPVTTGPEQQGGDQWQTTI
jgi:conjugative relaxase-like TrwC/TraI family protein